MNYFSDNDCEIEDSELVSCSECGPVFDLFVCDECPACNTDEALEPTLYDVSDDQVIMSMLFPGRAE